MVWVVIVFYVYWFLIVVCVCFDTMVRKSMSCVEWDFVIVVDFFDVIKIVCCLY